MKIISDSSSNLLRLQGADYVTVPLKVIAGAKEYVDDEALDVAAMMDELKTVKGKTHTSCPNVYEWKQAAGDAQEIVMITITGSLSGSYASALEAARELREEVPPRKVAVINSLSTGPEMQLLIERMQADIAAGATFEEVEASVRAYHQHTHLLFALQCMDNLARNGRVNPLVAKMAGFLGIHAIGEASAEGKLQMLHKARGRQKAAEVIYAEMEKNGYAGGKVRIAHSRNAEAANAMAGRIRAAYPDAPVEIVPATALCSFYAEEGGLLIGYEDGGC